MNRPSALVPDSTSIPPELKEQTQWVCWKFEYDGTRWRKKPIDPKSGNSASHSTCATWGSFREAWSHYEDRADMDGIGFVFTDTGPFLGVDLDDCRNAETGEMEPRARQIIQQLDAYTEVSPSGTGVHVLLVGDLPDGGNRKGEVEMYDTARFFTVTGRTLNGYQKPPVARQTAIETVHSNHIATDTRSSDDTQSSSETYPTNPPEPSEPVELSDRKLIEKAKTAKNGDKFRSLWNGNTSNYPSHSEADAALCTLLAFWTGRDADRIDRLFRRSGLIRDKWDEIHYADGSTYGERTIERATRVCSATYSGDSVDAIVSLETEAAVSDGGRAVVSQWTILGVLEALQELGAARTSEISDHPAFDRSQRQARNAIRYLESEGMVTHQKDGRKVVYELTDAAP